MVAVLADDLTGAGMSRETVLGGLTPEIFRDLASVEALWRGFECDPAVLATPYQRFDWVSAYVTAETPASLRILVLRDGAGRPRMIMPLAISCEHGVSVARVVGGKHANYHMPVFASREAAAMSGEDLRETLRRVGREVGADVYALSHQPLFWDGAANPMSLRAEQSPSDAYGLLLGPDAEATMRRVFSADARKKLRAKEKKLTEAFGPVAHRVAATPETATAYLEAFYAQKAARFAEMGIANP
ncbi:MAG TPA: GNAT family N-acetyltransferase, partial [Methylobacterium sp.]